MHAVTKLAIADTLSLPIDAATQTFAFIARKGGGKTYAAGKLVELLYDAGVQVVVLDTVGNWYGLRLAADGKRAGLDIPVLGGLRGDIPLEAAGGALIADVAVDTGRSLVLDASQFNLADRKRFATAFGHQLWARKKGQRHPSPLHFVIEESQLIVPQQVKGSEGMVGIYEEIIRLGRNYGIGVSMITQRPQSVNKEVLNQTECLFVGQVNGAHERKALKEWVTHQGMSVDLVDELPSLKVGTFYVWSPQWLQILEKVRIGKKRTFDASATPKVGDTREARDLKPLDLALLQTQLADTIERQKQSDPKALQQQVRAHQATIRALEQSLADLRVTINQLHAKKEKPGKPVVTDAQMAAIDRYITRLDATITKVHGAVAKPAKDLREALVKLEQSLASIKQPSLLPPVQTSAARPSRHVTVLDRQAWSPDVRPAPAAVMGRTRHVIDVSPAIRAARDNGGGTGVQQRILAALRELEAIGAAQPVKELVAVMADYANVRSKGFANAIGALRTAGLVTYPSGGTVALTPEGRAEAPAVDAPRTPADVQQRVCQLLGGASERILQPLIEAYPHGIERAQLASLAGYENIRSKGFANALGRLRTLGFVTYPDRGTVAAAPVLFLEG